MLDLIVKYQIFPCTFDEFPGEKSQRTNLKYDSLVSYYNSDTAIIIFNFKIQTKTISSLRQIILLTK